MSVQMNIERQLVIQCGNLTIDSQRCTVLLDGKEADIQLKKFDVHRLFDSIFCYIVESYFTMSKMQQEGNVKWMHYLL